MTSEPGVQISAVVEAVRRANAKADLLVVGRAEELASTPDDVARIVLSCGDVPADEPTWQALRWALAEDYDEVISLPASRPAAAVPILVEALRDADAAIGSRFGARRRWRAPDLSRAGNLAAQTLFRLPIRDTTSRLMGFKRHVLEAINLADLRAPTAAWALAVKLRAYRLGFTLAEVPIEGLDVRPTRRREELVDAGRRVLQLFLRGR